MNSPISSYPKILTLGHPTVQPLMGQTVWVQEKIDGSQFSFMKDQNGRLHFRSKGAVIHQEDVPTLFRPSVRHVERVAAQLLPAVIYRGEALCKPKHNTLEYERVPNGHIALYDIQAIGAPVYMTDPARVAAYAEELQMEPVPFWSITLTQSTAESFLVKQSCLGGQRLEGVVMKRYDLFDQQTGHPLFAKLVREDFKEAHREAWRHENPTQGDVVEKLIADLKSPVRWEKAVWRLRDAGLWKQAPEDIGTLLRSIKEDIRVEEEAYIKDILYRHFIGKIERGATAGFPEWYKRFLLHLP